MQLQITAISKHHHSHEGITHYWTGETPWSRPEAVSASRNGTVAFYTLDGAKKVPAEVVEANPPYLRSRKDGKWADNLLALPTRPAPASTSIWR